MDANGDGAGLVHWLGWLGALVVGSAAVWVAQELIGGNDGGQPFAVRMGGVGVAGAYSAPVGGSDLGMAGVGAHAQDGIGVGPAYAHRGSPALSVPQVGGKWLSQCSSRGRRSWRFRWPGIARSARDSSRPWFAMVATVDLSRRVGVRAVVAGVF